MNRIARVALLAVPLLAVAAPRSPTAEPTRPSSPPWADGADLLVFAGEQPARLSVAVEIDGKPVRAVWEKAVGAVVAFLDRDGDKSLSSAEAARLPSAFDLRRLMWGQSFAWAGAGEKWKDIDADADGKLTTAEVSAFYRKAGLGVQVAAGLAPDTDRLTAALVKALDTNGDGKLTEAELKAAEKLLTMLDANGDGVFEPSELVKGVRYPGVTGGLRLDPPAETDKRPAGNAPAMWALPADTKDTRWASALAADGKTSAAEFVALRSCPAVAAWTARLGKDIPHIARDGHKGGTTDALATTGLRVIAAADPGRTPDALAGSHKREQRRFDEADTDRAGFITPAAPAVKKEPNLGQLIAVADRDADGKLTRAELDGWLALLDALAAGQVLVTVIDHRRGLFEALDADGDGRLSARELRTASDRLKASGCVVSGTLAAERLPHTVRLTVSRGHPVAAVVRPVRAGPAWFRAMDRNDDGDVSRTEFTGPADVFDKLDADKDGLLNADEADKADVKP